MSGHGKDDGGDDERRRSGGEQLRDPAHQNAWPKPI